jgi:hypothetical protein
MTGRRAVLSKSVRLSVPSKAPKLPQIHQKPTGSSRCGRSERSNRRRRAEPRPRRRNSCHTELISSPVPPQRVSLRMRTSHTSYPRERRAPCPMAADLELREKQALHHAAARPGTAALSTPHQHRMSPGQSSSSRRPSTTESALTRSYPPLSISSKVMSTS